MHFKTLQTGLFISLLVAATGLFGWLLSVYVLPIFWAAVLAIVFHPLYTRILEATKQRASVASLLTITIVLVLIVVPVYILGSLVTEEAIGLYLLITESDASSLNLVAQMQILLEPLQSFGIAIPDLETKLVTFAQNFTTQVGGYALDIGRATASTAISTLLMLYILFFAFRDGEAMVQRVMQALPLGETKEKMLSNRFVGIVHAMFKGTFAIAVIQGAIGGLLFFAVGIESAVLWAFVMALFALIPAVGPAIVWLPAGLLLLASGSIWQGITVLAVGSLVIGLIDNLLRPMLVAREAAMPDVLILLSVIGGLSLFGIAGIIIGPVVSAFFLSMWQLFEHDYADDLKKFG